MMFPVIIVSDALDLQVVLEKMYYITI